MGLMVFCWSGLYRPPVTLQYCLTCMPDFADVVCIVLLQDKVISLAKFLRGKLAKAPAHKQPLHTQVKHSDTLSDQHSRASSQSACTFCVSANLS